MINTRMTVNNTWLSQRYMFLWLVSLLLLITVGCVPVSAQPPEHLPTSANEVPPTQPPPSPTATVEVINAGWKTFNSQRCEYGLSYPPDLEIWDNNAFSHTFGYKLADPNEGARNFIYISVVDQEIQSLNIEDIYNYDPTSASLLFNLQVGESKSLNDDPQIASYFTYRREPDTTISDFAAQKYENVQPWEFPSRTKEVRYYLSLNGCTYQIGGYLDTIQTNQPGAITEDLFNQIVATIHLMP